MRRITLAFSTHRPETLPASARHMRRHEVILLEEPPVPEFLPMVAGELSIGEYLEGQDFEFPAHAESLCGLVRQLVREGRAVLQVEPYLETLNGLHDLFASGGSAADIDSDSPAARVYRAERAATRALVDYYRVSLAGDFEAVVESVKTFARADAARLRLRDSMRAAAVIELLDRRDEERFYVEAGYIHWALWGELRRGLGGRGRVRVVFPLEPVVRHLSGRRQVLGPGDCLTLIYVFHPSSTAPVLDLLAARSLIYIKILTKEEDTASNAEYPHTQDEIGCLNAVRQLSFEDCRSLFMRLRARSTAAARAMVEDFLDRRRGT